jgi:hypothetical protein
LARTASCKSLAIAFAVKTKPTRIIKVMAMKDDCLTSQ